MREPEFLPQEPPPGLSATGLRRRVVEAACAVADARCGLVYETVRIGRRLFFADVIASGSPDFEQAGADLEGRSLLAYVNAVERSGGEAWPGDLNPTDRFAVTDRSDVRARGAWRMLWQPSRLRSALGMSVAHEGRLLGTVICARRLGEAPFGRTELSALRPLEASMRAWLIAASSRFAARCNPPDRPSYLMFDPDGTLMSMSSGAAPWVRDAGVIDRIGARVRAMGTDDGAVSFVLRAQVRLEVLAGARRSVLAVVHDGDRHRPGAREKLTAAQRRVGDLAVAGATVKEIAASLDRSPETIRDHLKAIYDRLGIGSRVELGRVLESPPPPGLLSEVRHRPVSTSGVGT